MPELPEVETIRLGLKPIVEGQRLVRVQPRRADLRFPFPPDLRQSLEGQRLERLDRRAKYLLWHMSNGAVMLLHLGMSGRIVIQPKQKDALLGKHDHLVIETDSGMQVLLNDARRFGYVDLLHQDSMQTSPYLAKLGPEPLSQDFDAAYLAQACEGRSRAIKLVIMDAAVVVGVGNIYANEALFAARIHPVTPAKLLSAEQLKALTQAIKQVLTQAIAAGGSSLKDYRQADGSLGYFQHAWRVYDRSESPCPVCRAQVVRIKQSGRSSFFCPQCQAFPQST